MNIYRLSWHRFLYAQEAEKKALAHSASLDLLKAHAEQIYSDWLMRQKTANWNPPMFIESPERLDWYTTISLDGPLVIAQGAMESDAKFGPFAYVIEIITLLEDIAP